MKVLLKILDCIFCPIMGIFDMKYADFASKESRKHPYFIVILSLFIVVICILIFYRNEIFL